MRELVIDCDKCRKTFYFDWEGGDQSLCPQCKETKIKKKLI